ncbi:hypothetical protein B0H19DRAFT_1120662 [Mycena capillaripes]|nr:hypothetical protein B0H19DRAFT_1120662 [Mycena capillaripes]
MLSTFTTPKRRRGLRGTARKVSREQLAAAAPLPSPLTPSSLYSQSSSHASSSSFSSTHTISEMSLATSMTSVSPASTSGHSHCVEESTSSSNEISYEERPTASKQHNYPPPLPPTIPLSPFEIFKLRLAAERRHSRKESSGSFLADTPVRVVRVAGRGGQGSRPRALPVDLNTPILPPAPTPLPPEIRRSFSASAAISPKQSTRIVGRGGVGSRPRGLLGSDLPLTAPQFVTPPPAPPPPPPQTSAMIQEVPQPPVVYRPGGRGGAGSRPRKVKPQTEGKEKEKDFKFPWKGKGKAKADVSVNALTRTDSRFSTVSSIAFAPAPTMPYPKPISPDPTPSIASVDSWDAHLAHQQSNRISKLTRTLGADFDFPGKSRLNGPQAPLDPRAAKLARRSSVSVPDTPLDNTPSSRLDYSARRQSSYGSLVQQARNDPPLARSSSHREVWESDEYRHSPDMRNNTDSPSTGYYPAPPRPSQAYPDALDYLDETEYLEDEEYFEEDVSEILSLNQSDDPRFSLNSESSAQVHVQPRFEIEDTDSEYGRVLTPTLFAPHSDDSRVATPLPDNKQRFESPFQTMPLFVLPWEPTDRPSGPAADGLAQEWSGEWNERDMQSVIRSLRTLKYSAD